MNIVPAAECRSCSTWWRRGWPRRSSRTAGRRSAPGGPCRRSGPAGRGRPAHRPGPRAGAPARGRRRAEAPTVRAYAAQPTTKTCRWVSRWVARTEPSRRPGARGRPACSSRAGRTRRGRSPAGRSAGPPLPRAGRRGPVGGAQEERQHDELGGQDGQHRGQRDDQRVDRGALQQHHDRGQHAVEGRPPRVTARKCTPSTWTSRPGPVCGARAGGGRRRTGPTGSGRAPRHAQVGRDVVAQRDRRGDQDGEARRSTSGGGPAPAAAGRPRSRWRATRRTRCRETRGSASSTTTTASSTTCPAAGSAGGPGPRGGGLRRRAGDRRHGVAGRATVAAVACHAVSSRAAPRTRRTAALIVPPGAGLAIRRSAERLANMLVAISISPGGDPSTARPSPTGVSARPSRGRPRHPVLGAPVRDQRDVHQHRGGVGRGDAVVVKRAVDVVAAAYPRVSLVLKADLRTGTTGS